MTLATPPFGIVLGGHIQTVLGNTHVKFLAAKNLGGHLTLAMPPFLKNRDYIRTVLGNTHVKFEVRSFNRFGAISI